MLDQSRSNRVLDGGPSRSTFLFLMLLAVLVAIVLLYFGGLFSPVDSHVS
jgi:hypothetical protein